MTMPPLGTLTVATSPLDRCWSTSFHRPEGIALASLVRNEQPDTIGARSGTATGPDLVGLPAVGIWLRTVVPSGDTGLDTKPEHMTPPRSASEPVGSLSLR